MGRYVVVDQDNFVPGLGLELDKEDMVDRDGYRDTESIVREFILAGERLENFRREEFDGGPDEVELELPVVRRSGFDMAEASMYHVSAASIAELEAQIAAIKAEQDVKAPDDVKKEDAGGSA